MPVTTDGRHRERGTEVKTELFLGQTTSRRSFCSHSLMQQWYILIPPPRVSLIWYQWTNTAVLFVYKSTLLSVFATAIYLTAPGLMLALPELLIHPPPHPFTEIPLDHHLPEDHDSNVLSTLSLFKFPKQVGDSSMGSVCCASMRTWFWISRTHIKSWRGWGIPALRR